MRTFAPYIIYMYKMDYLFSLAKRSDTPEILKLYQRLVGTPGCTWHAGYPNRDTAEADIDREALYLVTDKRYRIVGVASVEAGEDGDEGLPWQSANPCYLSRLGVLPEYQGRGIATWLLQKVSAACRRQGHDGIRLWAGTDNTAAIRLYEQNGFVRRGQARRHGLDFWGYERMWGK